MYLRPAKPNRHYMNRQYENSREEGEFMNSINEVNEYLHCHCRGAVIGAVCRVQLQGRFFLLVELEIGSGPNEIERVIVIEISQALFNALAGRVDLCEVRTTLPNTPPGTTLDLLCTFVLGNEAFIVFEIENRNERLVIVRSPLCTVI